MSKLLHSRSDTKDLQFREERESRVDERAAASRGHEIPELDTLSGIAFAAND